MGKARKILLSETRDALTDHALWLQSDWRAGRPATMRGGVFDDRRLHRWDLAYARFENCVFDNCHLLEVNFRGAVFHNCTFKNCWLRRVVFDHAVFMSSTLTDNQYRASTFEKTVFAYCTIIPTLPKLMTRGAALLLYGEAQGLDKRKPGRPLRSAGR